MKKLATTFGLLALMLIVTSFTTPNEIGGGGTQTKPEPTLPYHSEIGGGGTQTKPEPTLPFSEIGGGGTQTKPEPTLP